MIILILSFFKCAVCLTKFVLLNDGAIDNKPALIRFLAIIKPKTVLLILLFGTSVQLELSNGAENVLNSHLGSIANN